MYYFYILRCCDNSLYCGITNNLEKRLKEHNEDDKKGAKYTRAKRPVTLVHSEAFKEKGEALKREWEVKKLIKSEKEALIAERFDRMAERT